MKYAIKETYLQNLWEFFKEPLSSVEHTLGTYVCLIICL
jgi:hypothetical protein